MVPEAAVNHLLECRDPEGLANLLAHAAPALTLEVVTFLKIHVDQEKLRNARAALEIADLTCQFATYRAHQEAIGLALWARGNALHHLNRNVEALQSYREAAEHYQGPERALERVRIQINQVAVLQALGDCETALHLGELARAYCSRPDSAAAPFLGILEINIGAALQQMGRLEEALSAYARGLEAYQKIGHTMGMARININRATVLEELHRVHEAEVLLRQALQAMEGFGLIQEAARAQLNLGRLMLKTGRFQAALRLLEAAQQSFIVLADSEDQTLAMLYRALVYQRLNLLRDSILLAEQAESRFHADRSPWLEVVAMRTKAQGLQGLGEYEAAEKVFRQAETRLLELRWHRAHEVTLERAWLAWLRGARSQAESLVQAVERVARLEHRPGLLTQIQLLKIQLGLEGESLDLPALRTLSLQAIDAATQRGQLELEIHAFQLLSRIEEQAECVPAAIEALERGLSRLEHLQSLIHVDVLRLAFMDDKQRLYEQRVRLALREGTLDALLSSVDRLYQAALPRLEDGPLEQGEDSQSFSELSQIEALREEWRWIQARVAGADEVAPHLQTTSPSAEDGLPARQREIELTLTDLLRRRQALRPAGAADRGRRAQVSERGLPDLGYAGRLQECLGTGQALLVFWAQGEQLYALVVTSAGIQRSGPLLELSALSRILGSWAFQMERMVTRSASTGPLPVPAQLRRLHELLIRPLLPSLVTRSALLVVLPPILQGLPLAALHDGACYLIERFQLTYLSAPSQLLVRNDRPAVSGTSLPGSGVIIGHSSRQHLPHARNEAEAVAACWQRRHPTRLFLDEEASLPNVTQALADAHLLHFATHAVYQPENPLFSWLELEQDRLTVADLYELRLPQNPLVYMSACETGRGRAYGGGVLGMSRALFAAGASSLIVSQWKVPDLAALSLALTFYSALEEQGMACGAAALQRAQISAIASAQHPFFWAGLIFVQG